MLDRRGTARRAVDPPPPSNLCLLRRLPANALGLGASGLAAEVGIDVVEVEFGWAGVALGLDVSVLGMLGAELKGFVAFLLAQDDGPAVLRRVAHLVVVGDLLDLEDAVAGVVLGGADGVRPPRLAPWARGRLAYLNGLASFFLFLYFS